MKSDRCKKLIAIAEHIARRQRLIFNDYGIDEVSDKIEVLHPPQDLLVTEDMILKKFEHKHTLHFLYVGGSFYSKGGAALLQALVKLRKDIDVKLTLIGNLKTFSEWRADPRLDSEAMIRSVIEKNKDWVSHYERLSNESVLQLMKTADVGFLPTRGDTYGYSVLEMQACGLPCVTPNLRALPEINNDELGWMIPVRLNKYGNEDVNTFEDLIELDDTIKKGLVSVCREIFNHPEKLCEKAIVSFRAVGERNNPVHYSRRLSEIYQECL